MKWISWLFILFFPMTALAGIEQELQKAFSEFNSSANITAGGAYKGQEAGYYTGGSIYLRTPSRSINPLNFQLPAVELGCGGVDAHLGAFSYINSDKLVQTLRSVGSNAATYAFSLALKQMSPQIMNQIEQVQSMLNWANELSIHDCRDAQKLVNNAASLLEEDAVGTCVRQHLKVKGTDYFKAKTECQTQEKVNAKNQEAKAQGVETLANSNLVWNMIQKNKAFEKMEPEMRYFLMSLTGTIIFKATGKEPLKPYFYPSKFNSNEIVSGLATGKPFTIYACQTAGCLDMVERVITLPKDTAFVSQVYKILKTMENKIIEDKDTLTEQERKFLELTRLPVYKLLNIQAAFHKGMRFVAVEQYAEVIALDVLHAFVDNSISDMMSTDKNGLIPQQYSEQLSRMMEETRKRAMELRLLQVQKAGTVDDMIAKVQMMEKQLASMVSGQLFIE